MIRLSSIFGQSNILQVDKGNGLTSQRSDNFLTT